MADTDTDTPKPSPRTRRLLAAGLRLLALAAVSGAAEAVVTWLLK
ncbi:hypothetical protein EDE04_7399 [Streptomyces sp. 2132.2]|nr:hypothetical protein [Streptomyces sp. 2132.2]ROQ89003.1 hypothetical protein EDE04_7399 [Streptomyces sp. 2132.2]